MSSMCRVENCDYLLEIPYPEGEDSQYRGDRTGRRTGVREGTVGDRWTGWLFEGRWSHGVGNGETGVNKVGRKRADKAIRAQETVKVDSC